MKYGGEFEGIVPDLLTKYRNTKSWPQRRQLERYMRTMTCPDCHGERLNEARPRGRGNDRIVDIATNKDT